MISKPARGLFCDSQPLEPKENEAAQSALCMFIGAHAQAVSLGLAV